MTYIIGSILPLLLLGGFVYGVWFLVKSAGIGRSAGVGADGDGTPVDTAEVAKSVAISVGLFVAAVACTVGLVDLVQFFVEDANRFAGSNSDLARGLSVLVIGVPVFAALARVAGRRYDRAAASVATAHPDLAWPSIYLVAALSVSLIVVLVSVTQIASELTNNARSVQSGQVVQLLVWLGAWAAHWFVGRPRFAIRGDAHLAIGSIVGLALMLAGFGGALYRMLERGYERVFTEPLAFSSDTLQWLIVGTAGLIVWVWHWLLHFDAPGSIEGDRRRSPLWFFTVVVAGVLPGLIFMLSSATGMVSGVLVWIIGSTTEDAADFFSPAPSLIGLFLTGMLTWAYHRWVLTRRGEPPRNEALRFHDYAVAAVGLVAVVGAFATLILLLVSTVGAPTFFTSTESPVNALIFVVTVLVAAAALWWWQWNQIDMHRRLSPVEESDSRWRKLYLIVGLAVAGVVLSVNAINVLFVVLRDLIDGQFSGETLDDIASPFGWAVAVAGAVWFHLGVWRSDRAVLAAATSTLQPPPPAPPVPAPAASGPALVTDAVSLRTANAGDFGEIFTLQRAAFVDEAVSYGTIEVPSLQETLAACIDRLEHSETVVAVADGRIVGAGSLRTWREGGPDIERLMVAPDRRRGGIARRLLDELESRGRAQGAPAVQLVVGAIVDEARQLYAQQGFQFVSQAQAPGGPLLLTLRKEL